MNSVALSEDLKIIVSGHQDSTIRRWNLETGDPIEEPISDHLEEVFCVAIRGNLIASGSRDHLLYRRNVTTCEFIGSALQGRGSSIICVAVTAAGKLILFGSWNGTIRRWDACTGEPVGFLVKAHHKGS